MKRDANCGIDAAETLKALPSAQPEEPSHDAVKEYCRKRCLSIVDSALLGKYMPSAQQWIPWDSGKLPGESGYYTVTAYDGTTKRVTHAKYQKRLKRWELTGAMAYWRVLAWLPPIEPWEGEEHGTSRTMLPKKSLR